MRRKGPVVAFQVERVRVRRFAGPGACADVGSMRDVAFDLLAKWQCEYSRQVPETKLYPRLRGASNVIFSFPLFKMSISCSSRTRRFSRILPRVRNKAKTSPFKK